MLSHAAGTGAPLAPATVRLTLILKAASLARGHSGVRPVVIESLLALANHGVLPVIPSKGSVGASGDLAPLAHLTAALIGVGEVTVGGKTVPAAEGLAAAGLAAAGAGGEGGSGPAERHPGLDRLGACWDCSRRRTVWRRPWWPAACRSMPPRAATCRSTPVSMNCAGSPARSMSRGCCAACSRAAPSAQSHLIGDERVQDPYSLRCQPQVMGACLDHLRFAAGVLEREANAVTDNPLVFPDSGDILSGGNFHAEPVAMASDMLALVMAETGAIAERRIALLMDTHLSGLPPFLVAEGGLNSGFMIAQVTAAALASENKLLAHPASVDSLPTSANQEDHVSMATHAARRLGDMAENTDRHRRDRAAGRLPGHRFPPPAGNLAMPARRAGHRARRCSLLRPRPLLRAGYRSRVPDDLRRPLAPLHGRGTVAGGHAETALRNR